MPAMPSRRSSRPRRARPGAGIAAVVAASCLLAAVAGAAPPDLEARLDRLAAELEAQREANHVPGMGFALVVDDAVVLARGFGRRAVEGDLAATERTLFAIGSTTKAMTAALIAQLVDAGTMSWDEPVRTHLPDFRLADAQADAEVTIRDLLCHRTGLIGTDLLWYGGGTSWDQMRPCIAKAELKAPFRAAFQYQNVMYLAAGLAAGNAAGTTWGDLLRARLLEPLGMDRASFDVATMQDDADHAVGYRWRKTQEKLEAVPMRDLRSIAPAGAVNACALELAQWVRLQLGRGEIDGVRLIDAARFDEMWATQIPMQPGTGYGLGWMITDWNGRRVVSHGGNIDGFSALVTLLPDDGIGFALLMNLTATPLQGTANHLVLSALLDDAAGEAVVDDADRARWPDRCGTYRFDVLNADCTVLERNGRLAIDVPGQMIFELEAPDEQGRRAFRGFPQILLSFVESEAGETLAVVIHQSGLRFELPKAGVARPIEVSPAEAAPLLGAYRVATVERDFTVLLKDGRLALDVPGEMVYELRRPDEDGRWIFRATDDIWIRFERDADGAVTGLHMNSRGNEVTLARTGDAVADPLPSGLEVMEQVRTALGAEAYEGVFNVRMDAQARLLNQGVDVATRTIAAGFDRLWVRTEMRPFGWDQKAMIGAFAWSQSTWEPWRRLEDDEARQMLQTHPFSLHSDWRETHGAVETMAWREEDGRRLVQVRLVPDDLPPRDVFVDALTGLPVREVQRFRTTEGQTIPIETRYLEWREHEGVMIPWRMRVDHPVLGRSEIEIAEIAMNFELESPIWYMEQPIPDAWLLAEQP